MEKGRMSPQAEQFWFRRNREGLFGRPMPIHWKGWMLAFSVPIVVVGTTVGGVVMDEGKIWLVLAINCLALIWLKAVIDRHTEYL